MYSRGKDSLSKGGQGLILNSEQNDTELCVEITDGVQFVPLSTLDGDRSLMR